jgi:Ras-related GTP-binding protein A/B
VFLHKIDIVQDKDDVIQYLTNLFSQNISQKIYFHPTSIFDESLFKAWSEIIQEMSGKSTYINTLLKQLKSQDGIRDAILVLRRTGLAVGSTFDMTEEELAVGMFSLLVVTIDRVTKEMKLENLREFRLRTNASYVLLTDVNPELLLVIILTKPNLDPEAMEQIESIVKEISQQIEKMMED